MKQTQCWAGFSYFYFCKQKQLISILKNVRRRAPRTLRSNRSTRCFPASPGAPSGDAGSPAVRTPCAHGLPPAREHTEAGCGPEGPTRCGAPARLVHAYPLIYSSRFLRRLRESSGIGQPGSSYRSAPDTAERPAQIVTSLQPLGRQPGDALLS
jgi:hypothetical protein